MKSKNFFLALLTALILSSSVSCDRSPDGICDLDEVIGFAFKDIDVPAAGDSVQVHINSSEWWLSFLIYNDQELSLDTVRHRPPLEIDHPNFRIHVPDQHNIHVYMSENTGDTPRRLEIHLQDGDCMAKITLKQAAP